MVTTITSDTISTPLAQFIIPIHDHFTVDLMQHFVGATAWISRALREDERHKILIHCEMGISRSVTIACAFLFGVNQHVDKRSHPPCSVEETYR